MRIKKLELVGFKSFKDRTIIHFDQGITGIVGPNGCGKSNIVDALIWVMGEMSAKHLRGSSMEDVIFAGADGYAPMGMAEVSLTLENDGGPFPAQYQTHSEIMVTRRLNRSGESEYLINKEPARLRDIQEIFMDTGAGAKGFSIIEQGAIGKIITAKPEDRRVLIEEAAGITKFKVRKRESQRKLISTEQNLVRLQDILGEQKRQLDSLERQAQRAERYRGLRRDLQDKEVLFSAKQYLNLDSEIQSWQQVYDEARARDAESSAELGQKEVELQDLRLQQVEKEKLVEQLQVTNQTTVSQAQNLEFSLRELQLEMEQARRSQDMTGSIVEQAKAREQALSDEIARVSQELGRCSVKATDLVNDYEFHKQKLVDQQGQIRSTDELLTQKRRELNTVVQSETHLTARHELLGEKIHEVAQQYERVQQVGIELETQKQQFAQRHKQLQSKYEQDRQLQLDIMRDVDNFVANRDVLHQQVEVKRQEVAQFKDALNEVASRLYGLENLQANFEGFEEGVRQIMLWQRSRGEASTAADLRGAAQTDAFSPDIYSPDIYSRRSTTHTTTVGPDGQMMTMMTASSSAEPMVSGSVIEYSDLKPISEFVEVDEDYEMAMEAALGQKLQLLMCEDRATPLAAIEFLKAKNSGRSSFISPQWMSSELVTSNELRQVFNQSTGVLGFLSDHVRAPESVRPVIHSLLQNVVIVDQLSTALHLRTQHQEVTFVTLEGDMLSTEGILTGGAAEGGDSGLLRRRREIKELSQKREEWAGKLALATAALKKLEAQLKQVGEELEHARRQQIDREVQLTELKKDLERASSELHNVDVALNKQTAEIERERQLLEKYQIELTESQQRLESLREQKLSLEQITTDLDREYTQSKNLVDELQKQTMDLQMRSASATHEADSLRMRHDMMQKSLTEVQEQLLRVSEESARNLQTLDSHHVLIAQKKVELEQAVLSSQQAQIALSAGHNEYEILTARIRELDQAVNQARQQAHQAQIKIGESQLKLEQLRLKVQYLVEQMHEKYMLILGEIATQHQAVAVDMVSLENEVNDLKGKVSRIGDVNLAAIEEYEDLQQRFQFLQQQFTDLTEAKDQLKRVIDRINRICSRRFKETFAQVNERFEKVFPVLFGGGEAKLILIEDPENGEMGIDIISRPPGKKLQNVSLLSGGEKALTAVSLIFSIFLVKPSPFCLLDEVDAPLDDANVFRFNDLVKEMAKRSQIIIVTHNKHTMKVNNILYGVTMEEKGVSKMVTVNLEQAEQVALEGA